jgi:hypothetical protein
VLAAPPAALAQGGGASTTNRPGVAQQGQGEQATPGPGPQSGQAAEGQPPRNQVEQQERATGVAPAPERREEQLRDLNELSRQLAPSNPVPAPGVGGDGARR